MERVRQSRMDWSNFRKLRDEQNRIRAAMCLKCGILLTTITTAKFNTHRNECNQPSTTNDAAENFEDEEEENIDDAESIQKVIDKKIARFFLACGISFRTVENPYFIDLINYLCHIKMSYKVPCRQVLATSILGKVHEEIQTVKMQQLEGTNGVLIADVWENKSKNRKYLIFTVRNENVLQAFLTFFDISIDKETAESLKHYIEEAMRIAKEKFNMDIFAIMTDNDLKIVTAGKLVKTLENKPLIQATCSSHSGNLIIKEFIDDNLKHKLRDIVNTFSHPQITSILQDRFGGSKLENFPQTKFTNVRKTCDSILKNLRSLRTIITTDDIVTIPDTVRSDIESVDFQHRLEAIVTQIDPICKFINECQNPTYNIADSAEGWLSLRVPNVDGHGIDNRFENLIFNREEKAIYPVGFAANFLHHKYKGNALNEDQLSIGEDFLKEHLDEQGLQELEFFIENRDNFKRWEDVCQNPIPYWIYVGDKLPNLAEFAIKIMTIPASTSMLESLFYNWTYVNNIYGSRLLSEKSASLVDTYHSLRHFFLKTVALAKENIILRRD